MFNCRKIIITVVHRGDGENKVERVEELAMLVLEVGNAHFHSKFLSLVR